MLITRFHDTETLQVSVEFLTPTFLGGADQNAELRAAPFKNLLRQWWRVAVGSQYPNHKEMLNYFFIFCNINMSFFKEIGR